jgi:hypothetical protein
VRRPSPHRWRPIVTAALLALLVSSVGALEVARRSLIEAGLAGAHEETQAALKWVANLHVLAGLSSLFASTFGALVRSEADTPRRIPVDVCLGFRALGALLGSASLSYGVQLRTMTASLPWRGDLLRLGSLRPQLRLLDDHLADSRWVAVAIIVALAAWRSWPRSTQTLFGKPSFRVGLYTLLCGVVAVLATRSHAADASNPRSVSSVRNPSRQLDFSELPEREHCVPRETLRRCYTLSIGTEILLNGRHVAEDALERRLASTVRNHEILVPGVEPCLLLEAAAERPSALERPLAAASSLRFAPLYLLATRFHLTHTATLGAVRVYEECGIEISLSRRQVGLRLNRLRNRSELKNIAENAEAPVQIQVAHDPPDQRERQ